MADNNELERNLRRLAEQLGTDYLYPAMARACAVVRNDAVDMAPHDTGELKRSIDFQVESDGTEGTIFSNLKYAPYVEVGTGIYAKRGGRDTPWTYPYYDHGATRFATTKGRRPQPYLEPALRQNTTRVRNCFEGMF